MSNRFSQFIRYALVGVTGTLLDLGVVFVFFEYVHVPLLVATSIGFLAAATSNFFLNKKWTFQNNDTRYLRLYLKFFIVSLVGLGLNNLVVSVLTYRVGLWYILAKLIASASVMLWNFISNAFWTFREASLDMPAIVSVPTCDFSVVIPAYNEELTIENTLHDVIKYFEYKNCSYEIIVVDDGSTDTTAQRVESISSKNTHVALLSLGLNQGKGMSVKTGCLAAKGKYIVFMDADNSTSISELESCGDLFSRNAELIIGSRYLKDSRITILQPWYRRLIGRVGNLCIQLLLLPGITDTQCGFKVFRYDVAHCIFPLLRIRRWAFDVEALSLAHAMKFQIIELPVNWKNDEARASRLRPVKDVIRTLRDLLVIKWNLVRGVYRTS